MKNLNIILNQIKNDSDLKKNRIIQRAYNIRDEKFIIKAIADAHVRSGEFIFDNKNGPVFTKILKYYNGRP